MPASVQDGVGEAVAHALQTVFLAAAPVAALGVLVALFLKETPLRGPGGTAAPQEHPPGADPAAPPREAPATRPITEGDHMSPATFRTAVLLRSEQSAGRVAVIENTAPAGWAGPPLHHHDFDEVFYVLDGELAFQVEDELLLAGAGALAFAPRGVHHTLANLSGAEARYLLVCTPGGFERYFDRIAAERAGAPPAPTAAAPYPETIVVGPAIGADRAPTSRASAPTGRVNVLLRSEESGGEVAIMDNRMPARSEGPFLHTHDFDETFYLVDGALTFQVGDAIRTVHRGEVAFAAGGVPHAFANRSDAPARFVLVCTPAGFERYFGRIAAERAGIDPPSWALQPIPEVTRVGPRVGATG